tara:strand:+ start:318 stop:449 length:132 start_codon:yes stop_codon:yes gene_type:complete
MTIDLNCDIDVKCQTIRVHSDSPGAVEIASAVKDAIAQYSRQH